MESFRGIIVDNLVTLFVWNFACCVSLCCMLLYVMLKNVVIVGYRQEFKSDTEDDLLDF